MRPVRPRAGRRVLRRRGLFPPAPGHARPAKYNNQPQRRGEGEERTALLRLHFLGKGGGGSLASSSPLEKPDGVSSGAGDCSPRPTLSPLNTTINHNDEAKEKSALRFSASFSSGKEVEDSWPLPLL